MFDREVALYLYKCLLRRRQALSILKPIGSNEAFDIALEQISEMLSQEDIDEANKVLAVANAGKIDIYIDASTLYHNDLSLPHQASISFIIYKESSKLYQKAEVLGDNVTILIGGKPVTIEMTVNVAEYMALIRALEFLYDNNINGNITIYSDSLLVVSQVNFTSSTKSPRLVALRDYVTRLKNNLGNVQVVHLNREQNTEADALAKSVNTG